MCSVWSPTQSTRVGSDGFVLGNTEFAAGQDWYLLVRATPGAQWTLVSGEAHVLNLGNVAPAVIRASITFNGTSKVLVTITGPGISQSCTLDLASQRPALCHWVCLLLVRCLEHRLW